MDCNPLSSSVPEISQARTLEGVTIPFSRGLPLPGDQTCISCIAGGLFTAELPGKPDYWVCNIYVHNVGFPGGLEGKDSTHSAGDLGLIPG